MADPITWRNVTGPAIADASRPMAFAQDALNSGFNTLGGAINKFQTGEEALWKKQDEAATQDVLAKIYAAKTVADLNALDQSGVLTNRIAPNGAEINRTDVFKLLDGREATLQNRQKAAWEFANAELDQKEAPVVNQVKGLIAQGKLAEAEPLINSLSARNGAAMFESLDKRQQEEIMRARGNMEFAWKGAEEAQKQQMRPLQLEAEKLRISGQKAQNALTGINLDKAKRDLADSNELRLLDDTVAAAQMKYLREKDTVGKNMGLVAKSIGLPLDSAGHPDFNNMTSAQIEQFDTAAANQKTVVLPKAKDFISGDTIAANQFYDSLSGSGKFRDATLKKSRDIIRSSFDSNAASGRVGNDAFNYALTNAQNKVKFDEQDANNWYAPNSENALRNYQKLAADVDKMFGENEREDLPHVQKYLHELATQGMVVGKDKNGKDIIVTPSVNDVLGAVRSTYEGWNVFNKGRMRDIKAHLQKTLETPEAANRFIAGEESTQYRRKEAVKALLSGASK